MILRAIATAVLALGLSVPSPPVDAAAFESSVLGLYQVNGEDGVERYVVLRPAGESTDFRFFPVDVELSDPGGISVGVSHSAIFDDDLALALTAALRLKSSSTGLAALKVEVAKDAAIEGVRFAPIGTADYRLYLFLEAPGINEEGIAVGNVSEGSLTPQSTISATYRLDSIGPDAARNLLQARNARIFFGLALRISYEITMIASPFDQLPDETLKELFDPTADLPLLPLYQRKLAVGDIFTIERDVKAISDLAGLMIGTTPRVRVGSPPIEWNLNPDRIEEEQPDTTLIKTVPVADVVRSTLILSSLCETSPDSIMDVDNVGGLC